MRRERVAVIGGYGFIGSAIANEAQQEGAAVLAIHFREPPQRRAKVVESFGASVQRMLCPSSSKELAVRLSEFVPTVIVLASGSTSNRHGATWTEHVESNIALPALVIDAMAASDFSSPPLLISLGSQSEYGRAAMPWGEDSHVAPADAYGATKLGTTQVLLTAGAQEGMRTLVVRLPIVFGKGQTSRMFIPDLIISLLLGARFEMTEGRQRRKFLDTVNLSKIVLELTSRAATEELPPLLNLPGFGPISIGEVADRVVEILQVDPSQVQRGAISLRASENSDQWPDDRLARDLGFSLSGTLDDALADTVDWYRQNLSLFA